MKIPQNPARRLWDKPVRWALAVVLLQFACITPTLSADEKSIPLERSVKAAFLYKFLSYVEWPESATGPTGSPLTIGVVGADDIAAELSKAIQDRSVNNRPLAVKRLNDGDSLAGIQVLFIGGSDSARLERWLKPAQARSVLTVTEAEDSAKSGVINFVPVDGRIRFDVSLEAAERTNLKLSSRMLSVARVVQKGTP
jgi:hypothetical protein